MPQPKPFTPGFVAAFEGLAKLAGTTPERLAADHKYLKPEQRFEKLKQKLKLMQNIPANTPGAIQKMTEFLKTLNDAMQDPSIAQALQAINKEKDQNKKMAMLKKLFQDNKVLEAVAEYWNKYIQSQHNNPKMEDIFSVLDENSKAAAHDLSSVDSQGNYDPEKKIVRDLIRLLFELFDIVLVQAGYKPVFAPKHGHQREEGLWDPKLGIYRGKTAHVPGSP